MSSPSLHEADVNQDSALDSPADFDDAKTDSIDGVLDDKDDLESVVSDMRQDLPGMTNFLFSSWRKRHAKSPFDSAYFSYNRRRNISAYLRENAFKLVPGRDSCISLNCFMKSHFYVVNFNTIQIVIESSINACNWNWSFMLWIIIYIIFQSCHQLYPLKLLFNIYSFSVFPLYF